MNLENIDTVLRYIEHTKRKISARDISGIVKIIARTKNVGVVGLHPIYNIAVKYHMPIIGQTIAKKISRIKPASEAEKSLANAIVKHNSIEEKLRKKLFS